MFFHNIKEALPKEEDILFPAFRRKQIFCEKKLLHLNGILNHPTNCVRRCPVFHVFTNFFLKSDR